METERTSILLVEDHVSFRQALAFMFEREPEFEVVGQAGSMGEVRELPDGLLRDVEVAVVDLALPDGDGLELIEDLSINEPQIMTLVLSASLEWGRFARAIEAGAGGVLHKSSPIKDIIDAVRRLKAGEALLSPGEVIEMLRVVSREREEKREALQAIEKITSRERDPPGPRRGPGEQRDRREVEHHRGDGAYPHGEHPPQARRALAAAGPGLRGAPRPRRDTLEAGV